MPFAGLLGSDAIPEPLLCSIFILSYLFVFVVIMRVFFIGLEVGFEKLVFVEVLGSPCFLLDFGNAPIILLFGLQLSPPELHQIYDYNYQ